MFERFTERARKVVVLAQEEARCFDHGYVGTEHLLLGLLREDEGGATRALGALGVTVDAVRERVRTVFGYGTQGAGDQAPFSKRARSTLKTALSEAARSGHGYVDTEHVLLVLVRESKGGAVRVLSDLGVGPEEVRREVAILGDSGVQALPDAGSGEGAQR